MAIVTTAAKFGRLVAAIALAGMAGCQLHLPRPYGTMPGPAAMACPDTPRELQKVTLPDYIIEPPDILTIDAVTLVPHPPYKLRPLDTLKIDTTGLPTDQAIGGDFAVGIDGTLVLGFGFDKVDGQYQPIRAAGLTLPEVRDAIKKRLEVEAREPEVWITLLSIAAQQEIAGEHLVAPDGTVNLGAYGRVRLVGHNARRSEGQR